MGHGIRYFIPCATTVSQRKIVAELMQSTFTDKHSRTLCWLEEHLLFSSKSHTFLTKNGSFSAEIPEVPFMLTLVTSKLSQENKVGIKDNLGNLSREPQASVLS